MFTIILTTLGAMLFLGLLLTILLISIRNRLMALFQRCENTFVQLSVHMTRRHELIAAAAESSKGGAHYAHELFAKVRVVTENARTALVAAESLHDTEAMERLWLAETELDCAVRQLTEVHCTLRVADDGTLLQDELAAVDSRIGFARDAYDEFAGHYNTYCMRFPTNLFARKLGFVALPLFSMVRDVPSDKEVTA